MWWTGKTWYDHLKYFDFPLNPIRSVSANEPKARELKNIHKC